MGKELQNLRIAYVCDGGPQLGLGHVSRGRALLAHVSGRLVVGEGFTSIGRFVEAVDVVPWQDPDLPIDPSLVRDEVVVVDHYGLPESWIAELARRTTVIVIDDWQRPDTAATYLVNPNIGASAEHYPGRPPGTSLCGARFAFIRPELAGHGRADYKPGRVVVTLGGGDSALDWRVAVEAIVAHAGNHILEIDVILGPVAADTSFPDTRHPPHVVRLHRAQADFAELCRTAEVVVCAASTTSHEMAYLGVAFVPVVTADNQERIGRGWEEAGVAPYLSPESPEFEDRLGAEVTSLLATPATRARRAAQGPALVDGRGAERILEIVARGNAEKNR